MTENKRFVMYEHKDNDYILDSPNTSLDFIEMLGDALSSEEIVDRLNEQEELIKRLKTIREEQTETILKQKRKIKELEERNKRQYNRLTELTKLMYEKQWGKLENIVEEWEKADELLEQEWGTYCGDKE